MTDKKVNMCVRCVMDSTDPDIVFDERGVCNHCHLYDRLVKKNVITGEEGRLYLEKIVAQIKKEGQQKEYDCIIGVSGGVDSTYVAYQTKKLGLRPLAVHLDNGWDSEIAVKNIENTLKKLNIELYTYVIDWLEFRDLQLAFLKASTPDAEIPTDHAIVALLYTTAKQYGVNYIIAGYNVRTETHLPPAWSQGHFDWRYIKNIHRKFGERELKTFPHMSLQSFLLLRQHIKIIPLLNYIDYSKRDAMSMLEQDLGWRYYGGKHYESIYTRFYQGYILPRKFGYDKRKTHFSSLICSGELTRQEALEELRKETYPIELQKDDREYVMKKFCLTPSEFENIMSMPGKSFWDYPSYKKLLKTTFYRAASRLYSKVFEPNDLWRSPV